VRPNRAIVKELAKELAIKLDISFLKNLKGKGAMLTHPTRYEKHGKIGVSWLLALSDGMVSR